MTLLLYYQQEDWCIRCVYNKGLQLELRNQSICNEGGV